MASAQTAGLSNPKNAADYLIIAPDMFSDGAAQLAAYRQQKGLGTLVASLDDIYNEFSYGVPTPDAIKQLLGTAMTQWSGKPKYAVLIGDGTYDYRDLLQKHDNLVPPMLVSTAYGLFCSDTAFSDLDGSGVPQIAIGRLPVKTADQLTAVLAKIKSYAKPTSGGATRGAADRRRSRQRRQLHRCHLQVNTTLVAQYSNNVVSCSQDVNVIRQTIQSNLNAGVDLFNYIGHGAIDRFGNSGYLMSGDVASLQDGGHLPVVVAVTCVAGQYSVPGADCLAEYLTLQNGGGAIAVIAPTGLSVNQDASRLNLRLMRLLNVNSGPGLGDMFRQAMADHITLDNPATPPAIYNLIGDPALAYNVVPKVVSAAPRFTSVTASNGVMVLTWSGGKAPYQLETRSALSSSNSWQSVGSPVSGTSAMVPMTDTTGFIRIRCSQ